MSDESTKYEKSIFQGNDENNGESSNETWNNLSEAIGLNEDRSNRDKGEEEKENILTSVDDDNYEARCKEEIAVFPIVCLIELMENIRDVINFG